MGEHFLSAELPLYVLLAVLLIGFALGYLFAQWERRWYFRDRMFETVPVLFQSLWFLQHGSDQHLPPTTAAVPLTTAFLGAWMSRYARRALQRP